MALHPCRWKRFSSVTLSRQVSNLCKIFYPILRVQPKAKKDNVLSCPRLIKIELIDLESINNLHLDPSCERAPAATDVPNHLHSKSSLYDAIIVGRGVAGLVAAARLSEDSNKSILVIEAGSDRRGDPRVDTPGMLMSTWGDPEYDWDFYSVPQVCNRPRLISTLAEENGINDGA